MSDDFGKKYKMILAFSTLFLVIISGINIQTVSAASGYERKASDPLYEVYFETPVYMPITRGVGGVEEMPIKYYVKMNAVHSGFLGLYFRGPNWYKITAYICAWDVPWTNYKNIWGIKRWYPAITTDLGADVSFSVAPSLNGQKAGFQVTASLEYHNMFGWDVFSPGSVNSEIYGSSRSSYTFKYHEAYGAPWMYWIPLGWYKNDFTDSIFWVEYPSRHSEGAFEIATARDYTDYLLGRSNKMFILWFHVDMHWEASGGPTHMESVDFFIGDHNPATDVALEWAEAPSGSSIPPGREP